MLVDARLYINLGLLTLLAAHINIGLLRRRSLQQKQTPTAAMCSWKLRPCSLCNSADHDVAVRAMMGVPAGGTGFAVEQKKKLLWGSKKVSVIGIAG